MIEERDGAALEPSEEPVEKNPAETAGTAGETPEAGPVTDGKKASAAERIKGLFKSGELTSGVRLVTLALIAAVLVAGVFCARAFGRYHALRSQYRGAVRAASETLAAAEAERADADPGSEASAEERRRTSEDMIGQAEAEIARIERHNGELDEAAREAEAKIGALEEIEDYEYYRAIYDEYVEGRAYVEELLSED